MVRSIGAIVAMAVLSLAAGQQLPNDEFSLLGIPRPGGVPMIGLPVMKINNLMEDILKDFAEEPSSSAAAPARTRMHVIHLPPMMSGLFHRDSTDEESPQTARPAATMQFGPLSMRIMSRPLGQLQALASNCVPCGRVQSHMRSINIMHGPNGQRVETVTEVYSVVCLVPHVAVNCQFSCLPACLLIRLSCSMVFCYLFFTCAFHGSSFNADIGVMLCQTGPDGEEHTTRTVMTDEAKPASGAVPETGNDLLDAILSPLMGGIPNFERIMQDVPALDKEEVKLAPPSTAAEPVVARKAEVSEEEAKQAVETAVTAEGLEVDSPEKRKVRALL